MHSESYTSPPVTLAGDQEVKRRPALSRHDRAIVGLLALFIVFAFTVELYWIVFHDELAARAQSDLLARIFAIYNAGDQAYFRHVSPFALGLETLNVFVTQPANLWLIVAIITRRPYRHALQLAVSSYVVYSVVLYFWTAYLSDYENMPVKDFYGFFIFVVPNLPWLCANLYLAANSIAAITRRFRE